MSENRELITACASAIVLTEAYQSLAVRPSPGKSRRGPERADPGIVIWAEATETPIADTTTAAPNASDRDLERMSNSCRGHKSDVNQETTSRPAQCHQSTKPNDPQDTLWIPRARHPASNSPPRSSGHSASSTPPICEHLVNSRGIGSLPLHNRLETWYPVAPSLQELEPIGSGCGWSGPESGAGDGGRVRERADKGLEARSPDCLVLRVHE